MTRNGMWLLGTTTAVWAVMGLASGVMPGCRREDGAPAKPGANRSGSAPANGLKAGDPVQVEVVRFSPEMNGTVSVFATISNSGPGRLLWAKVVCEVTDVTGQPIGSIAGEPLGPNGLGKGESVDFHWFVPVDDAGAAVGATARVEQVKTE